MFPNEKIPIRPPTDPAEKEYKLLFTVFFCIYFFGILACFASAILLIARGY